jgi:hypothetical protein
MPSEPGAVIPDQATLVAMSVGDLEQLLARLLAEHKEVTLDQLYEDSMLDGSPRTSSVFMLALLSQIENSIGQKLVKPADLDDSGQLRTLRGAAQVLKKLLARWESIQ